MDEHTQALRNGTPPAAQGHARLPLHGRRDDAAPTTPPAVDRRRPLKRPASGSRLGIDTTGAPYSS